MLGGERVGAFGGCVWVHSMMGCVGPKSLVLDGHWLAFHKSHGPESQELL